jgi:esterase/lipase
MGQEKVIFPSASGSELSGRLDLPDDNVSRGCVLFAHCFTGSKDVLAAVRISKALWLQGFTVFRFDFTGLGESGGDFSNTTFSSNIDDLLSAAEFLRENYEPATVMIGHSLGGAAVLASAVKIPEVHAICTIGAPSDPKHVVHHFSEAKNEIEQSGEAEVAIGGRPFRIKRSFLEDIKAHNLEELIGEMRKALLVFHSPIDDIVGIENAGHIYGAARHPKNFVCLDGADHMLTNKADAYYVAEVVCAWANRYNKV